MALLISNQSGLTAYLTIVREADPNEPCSAFSYFSKSGWIEVKDGVEVNVWDVDLLVHNPVGAFFAEELTNGKGVTWGHLGANNRVQVPNKGTFDQCVSDNKNCNQTVELGILALNTGSNARVTLKPDIPLQPNWEFTSF
jgi:hypothetical protein